jgi:carboxyl-terminal processing protease
MFKCFKIILSLFVLAFITKSEAALFANKSNNIKTFEEVLRIVREEYVEDIPEDKLITQAISGMLMLLDPHSGYLDKASYNDVQLYTKGEFGGVGIELTVDNGMIKVLSPIDGSPAQKAGIKPGDYITYIDDESLFGLTANDAIQKIRGKPGTSVKLTIVREDLTSPVEVKLQRELIKIESVSSGLIGNNAMYLRIASFAENTPTQVKKELQKYLKSNAQPKGIILDVRNNPGGLLDQAINVADIFLEKGLIVYTKGRAQESINKFEVNPKGFKVINIPIVLLINSGSASGAEILAGALKDHSRAVLMGTRTYGKGSVQEVTPLENGNAISITTALYYTPSGRSIQAEGVEPDIVVEDIEFKGLVKNNNPMREENLHGHLNNDDSKKLDFLKLRKNFIENRNTGQKFNLENDYQLSRAVDLLKGLLAYDGKKIQ